MLGGQRSKANALASSSAVAISTLSGYARWSLVAGRWALGAGRWSLVAGRWSLVAA
jgi:uncharacterized protein (DUF2237 family)